MYALDQIIKPHLLEIGPGLAAAVVSKSEVVHRQGYGLANMEWQIPIEPDTVFRLASITKQFTAVAIMMLVEAGKLSLDDLLSNFLPDYPTSGHDVSIYHLLTHTSGIKSYTSIEDWFPDRIMADMTPEALCNVFSQIPFDFKPGAKFSYNNSGYHLLGMIIERVAECTYEEFMQTHIFEPIGMKQSYYLHNRPVIPKRASGYQKTKGSFENAPYLSMTQPYAAGSLGSTLDDLILWDQALAQNRLISQESFDLMVRETILNDGTTAPYGFGFGVHDYHGHRLAHHSGGIHGFNTFIARFLDTGLTIILLANIGLNLERMMRQIARLQLGLPDLDYQPLSLSETALDRVCGKYLLGDQAMPLEFVREGETLFLRDRQEDKILLALSETRFCLAPDWETEIHFSEEKEGCFHHLKFIGPFFSDEARRESNPEA